MSDRVQSRKTATSDDWQSMSKSERRAAAKAAAAKAAAAKRRRQAIAGALAGLAVIGVIVAAFVFLGPGDSDDASDTTASNPSASAGTPPADAPANPANPANPAVPPLPEGADPALGTKPATSAGQGDVTKLTVTPLVQGKGATSAAGQSITVNYVGVSYKTGEEFDASWTRGQPISFKLGGGEVIPGWDQGLLGVKVGSRVQLDIPADLAYGENPSGGRPAGALRFVVDVLALG
jgi:peptidylprolyl isomerase